jgi:hypothetical protein
VRIRSKRLFLYSETGAEVQRYFPEEEYEVSDECARYAVGHGLAEVVKAEKDKGAAPHNKARGAAPRNK